MKGANMASFDEIKAKATAAIDQAAPVVEGAVSAGKEKVGEFAERADDWASGEHPHADKAFEAVSGVAEGAVNKVADGANVAYEFLKDKAEQATGKDVDGDGQVGKTGVAPEDATPGVKVAADAAAGAAGKAVGAAKKAAERVVKKDLDGDGQIG